VVNQPLQQVEPVSDLDLYEAVRDAVLGLDQVRGSDLALDVNVINGEVTLSGVVLSRIMHRAVLQAAAGVPGIKRVMDNLRTDTDIEMAIGQALAKDPILWKGSEISATSYRGDVTLAGKAASEDAVQKAGEIAAKVPGVVRVYNKLIVDTRPNG
jgi:osmotically-inducible protein OsmY